MGWKLQLVVAPGQGLGCPPACPDTPRTQLLGTSETASREWFLERNCKEAVKDLVGDQKWLILDQLGGWTQGVGQRQGPHPRTEVRGGGVGVLGAGNGFSLDGGRGGAEDQDSVFSGRGRVKSSWASQALATLPS